jgi:hypothetical protein
MADFIMREESEGLDGETRFTPQNTAAAIRISVIADVPAESVTIGNWARSGFADALAKDGFTFEWEGE